MIKPPFGRICLELFPSTQKAKSKILGHAQTLHCSGKMIIWYFSFGLFINLNESDVNQLFVRTQSMLYIIYYRFMYLRNQSLKKNPKQGCILWGFPSWLKSWAWIGLNTWLWERTFSNPTFLIRDLSESSRVASPVYDQGKTCCEHTLICIGLLGVASACLSQM